jgi:hypothetical protein
MKLGRREFISTTALSAIGGALAGCGGLKPNPANPLLDPPKLPCCWRDIPTPKTIAIVGDIQRTNQAEITLLGRSQNDVERQEILNGIAGAKPDMLLMLGDQVAYGEGSDDWYRFDDFMKNIHYADIPVRALLGNHDYGGRSVDHCLHHFTDRFPHQKGELHGLTVMGPLALVTLNSNFEFMTPQETDRQLARYIEMLNDLDADPDIRGVIVASHHPPFSNGGYSLKPEIKDMFAVPFARARKTRIYLSGHVHNYQRFKSGDKQYIVTGGGGGARHEIDISNKRPYHDDAYRVASRLRPFHYVMLTMETNERTGEAKITGETQMLQMTTTRGVKNFSFDVGDKFTVGLYG